MREFQHWESLEKEAFEDMQNSPCFHVEFANKPTTNNQANKQTTMENVRFDGKWWAFRGIECKCGGIVYMCHDPSWGNDYPEQERSSMVEKHAHRQTRLTLTKASKVWFLIRIIRPPGFLLLFGCMMKHGFNENGDFFYFVERNSIEWTFIYIKREKIDT